MSDDKPKIHAMARKLHLAADRIAERAPEDNATLLRAAADCIDVLWRIGEARAAYIETLRARELDATAAPVVVGEDLRMIRQLVWRIKNDVALLKMSDLEADCAHALPALERILTAAMAGD